MIILKTTKIQFDQDPSFQRKQTLNELQMLNNFIIMYIYLLIQTLKCEQKLIIHESLAFADFNSPVSQLLLCPEWLCCHYKCHSSLMLENLHVRHSILAFFFLDGMVIRPGIFLLHISGSVDYWFHFLCITCSVQHYHHLDWGREGWSICCCLSVSLYTYAPTFVFAHLALCQRLYVIHDVNTSSSSL